MSLSASARQNEGFPVAGAPDTISLGYGIGVDRDRSAWTQAGVGREVLDNAPQIDAAKALYGRIAGLNVYQGVGTTADNIASLSIHGQAPLVLVDGFPRDLKNLTVQEIESVVVLKDAAAVALYGVRGANGVVMVSTRRERRQAESGCRLTVRRQHAISRTGICRCLYLCPFAQRGAYE